MGESGNARTQALWSKRVCRFLPRNVSLVYSAIPGIQEMLTGTEETVQPCRLYSLTQVLLWTVCSLEGNAYSLLERLLILERLCSQAQKPAVTEGGCSEAASWSWGCGLLPSRTPALGTWHSEHRFQTPAIQICWKHPNSKREFYKIALSNLFEGIIISHKF